MSSPSSAKRVKCSSVKVAQHLHATAVIYSLVTKHDEVCTEGVFYRILRDAFGDVRCRVHVKGRKLLEGVDKGLKSTSVPWSCVEPYIPEAVQTLLIILLMPRFDIVIRTVASVWWPIDARQSAPMSPLNAAMSWNPSKNIGEAKLCLNERRLLNFAS